MIHQEEYLLCICSVREDILNQAKEFEFNEDDNLLLVDAVFNSIQFCSKKYLDDCSEYFNSSGELPLKIGDFLNNQHELHQEQLRIAFENLTAGKYFDFSYLARGRCIVDIFSWFAMISDQEFRQANCLTGKIAANTDINLIHNGGVAVIYQMPFSVPKLREKNNLAYSVSLDEQGALNLWISPGASLNDFRLGIGKLCRYYASLQANADAELIDSFNPGKHTLEEIRRYLSEIENRAGDVADFIAKIDRHSVYFRRDQFMAVILGLICWDFCKLDKLRIAGAVERTSDICRKVSGRDDPDLSKEKTIENAYSKIVSHLNRAEYNLYFA